jgi:stalled ribosome rescue protein Dom34
LIEFFRIQQIVRRHTQSKVRRFEEAVHPESLVVIVTVERIVSVAVLETAGIIVRIRIDSHAAGKISDPGNEGVTFDMERRRRRGGADTDITGSPRNHAAGAA